MERLTIDEAIMHAKEVARERKNHATYTFPSLKTYYDECEKSAEEHEQLAKWLEELKHYKDLEEQGRLIELPCVVGATVYMPNEKFPAEIEGIRITPQGTFVEYVQYDKGYEETEVWDEGSFRIEDIGKTVFLTSEEAEAKLKEMREEN